MAGDGEPLVLIRGDYEGWVLLPPAAIGDQEVSDGDWEQLSAVRTIGELRAFVESRPGPWYDNGGPGAFLEVIDHDRMLVDPGDWAACGFSDDSPWSIDQLAGGDIEWPWPRETLVVEALDEDLVDGLLDQGLAEYREVGGPRDWFTIPDEQRTAAAAYAESLGYAVEVRESDVSTSMDRTDHTRAER